jgi:hypothetical protein
MINDDPGYARYVDGKTISVVGRATPFKDQSAEIAEKDLICVTSYFGESVPEYYSRCEISVFSRYNAKQMRDDAEKSERLSLDWALLRTPKYMPTGKFKTRVVGGPAYFFNLGNQVPIFINDIVKFSPEKVTIYGTDLYLSGYDTTRPQGDVGDFKKWKDSVVEHEQPKNRRYYQLMCELYPFIVPDERLDRILGMTDSNFWSELSDVWGGL